MNYRNFVLVQLSVMVLIVDCTRKFDGNDSVLIHLSRPNFLTRVLLWLILANLLSGSCSDLPKANPIKASALSLSNAYNP